MNLLIGVDHWLFGLLNREWTNSFFDWFFPAITDLHKNPLAFALTMPLLALWYVKKQDLALKWMAITLISVGLSDVTSYRLIKPLAQRERPPNTGIEYKLRSHRHSGSSFPSNHAANVFAAASTLSVALPTLGPVFFAWAFLIAYSRVYVGVHFPLDVIGGAAIGLAIAFATRRALKRWLAPKVKSVGGSSRARK